MKIDYQWNMDLSRIELVLYNKGKYSGVWLEEGKNQEETIKDICTWLNRCFRYIEEGNHE